MWLDHVKNDYNQNRRDYKSRFYTVKFTYPLWNESGSHVDRGIGLALFLHCSVALSFIIRILLKKKKNLNRGGGTWVAVG